MKAVPYAAVEAVKRFYAEMEDTEPFNSLRGATVALNHGPWEWSKVTEQPLEDLLLWGIEGLMTPDGKVHCEEGRNNLIELRAVLVSTTKQIDQAME